MKALRLILGDQLSEGISSLSDMDKGNDMVLMMEVWEEATYVKHHKKKIAFVLSAMRHFAEELKANGCKVQYVKMETADNTGSFKGEIARAIEQFKPDKVIVTEPSEYRVLHDILSIDSPTTIEVRDDDRFLCSHEEFNHWAKGRKQMRMEFFYREMRKKYDILIENEGPEGGQWNYDAENRKPPKEGLGIPATYSSIPDDITNDVLKLVEEKFADHFGDLEPFYFAVTRKQALSALEKFIKERLCHFGTYQDAMIQGEPWMYHSHLSFYINIGLLLPLECIQAAETSYRNGHAPLNAVEGFIRQILGWREFVRGIYWLEMPNYETENYLNAKRKLPPLFWGQDTHMNCLRQCVNETKENAYAHHIQRLMILGNFALVAGLDPNEVNEWYLIVYADALHWVELPNVTGMILHADGGLLGSKPYAASGNYINKMSNYCKGCRYSVTKKNGDKACPFNYLYWDFLIRNEGQLRGNARLNMVYRSLDRMDDEKRIAVVEDSQRFFKAMDKGDVV